MDTNNTRDILKKLYTKIGYFDKYGGSVIMTILIFLVFFLIFSYFNVMQNIRPLKENWNSNKCKPSVIPFAGLINKPANMSAFEYTGVNFSECLNSIQLNITGVFFEPIYYILNGMKDTVDVVGDGIQMIRRKISSVVDNTGSMDGIIMSRIAGFLRPIQTAMIKIRDMFGKVLGISATTLYSTIGLWLSIKTFIGAFMEMMVAGIITLSAMIVILFITPFTWGIAFPLLAACVFVISLLAVILNTAHNISDYSGGVPKAPACFDGNTSILLYDGSYVKIKDMKLNMKLNDGSYITSFMKVSQNNMNMYSYNGIIVSGNHNVLHNNKWIPVEKILEAIKINNYKKPYLYCLNTTSKKIVVNNTIFSDWDDIDNEELIKINNKYNKIFKEELSYDKIHTYMDGGFNKNTLVKLINGEFKQIENICIGDEVYLGGKVTGLVITSMKDKELYDYNINNKKILGGINNIYYDDEKKINTTFTLTKNKIEEKPKFLYNIITSNGLISIEDITFGDFSSSMEAFLFNEI